MPRRLAQPPPDCASASLALGILHLTRLSHDLRRGLDEPDQPSGSNRVGAETASRRVDWDIATHLRRTGRDQFGRFARRAKAEALVIA